MRPSITFRGSCAVALTSVALTGGQAAAAPIDGFSGFFEGGTLVSPSPTSGSHALLTISDAFSSSPSLPILAPITFTPFSISRTFTIVQFGPAFNPFPSVPGPFYRFDVGPGGPEGNLKTVSGLPDTAVFELFNLRAYVPVLSLFSNQIFLEGEERLLQPSAAFDFSPIRNFGLRGTAFSGSDLFSVIVNGGSEEPILGDFVQVGAMGGIPEPATLAVWGILGCVGLRAVRRRTSGRTLRPAT